ncbi:MAG: Ig-like domain-containing domain [Limisphaerales bacterium]
MLTLVSLPSRFCSLTAGLGMAALAAAGSLQASLDSYGVFKGEHYVQVNADVPGDAQREEYGLTVLAATSPATPPFLVYAQPGGELRLPVMMQPLEDRPEWVAQARYETELQREASFPDGPVSFQLLDSTGSTEATLTLTTSPLPPTPAVANYAETQAIDPAQPFTLRWHAVGGAEAQDRIWVRIESADEIVFSTPLPGASGTLEGSATQVVIPAGMLTERQNSRALITFLKVGAQAAGSLPGSTALIGSYRQTAVDLKLQGGGTGEPPVLLSSLPASGALNLPLDTSVRFEFSRPMAPVADLVWQVNGTPVPDVGYAWSTDGFTLLATFPSGLPADALITWRLGSGFEDTTGNQLEGGTVDGFFTTGSGGGIGDCEDEDPLEQAGNFFLSRLLRFLQSGPETTVSHPQGGAFLVAGFHPPADLNASGASFTSPSGSTDSMQSVFGSPFFFYEQFVDAAGLDGAYPHGNYQARVEPSAGSPIQMSISTAGAFPPTPTLINHGAAQAVEASAPFPLTWNAFTGADDSSFIGLEIANTDEDEDVVFSAPNRCRNIDLPPTATSIVLPAKTLQPGRLYSLRLTFYRLTDTSKHTATQITFIGADGVSTETTLRTLGSAGGEVRISQARLGDNDLFQATVTGPAGSGIVVESGTTFTGWETVTTLNLPASGSASFEDTRPSNPPGYRLYRARSL